jgi:hypothetical protein
MATPAIQWRWAFAWSEAYVNQRVPVAIRRSRECAVTHDHRGCPAPASCDCVCHQRGDEQWTRRR